MRWQLMLSTAELNSKLSALEAEQRKLLNQVDEQSQAYLSLTQKMHSLAQDHEQKTKEMDDAAQAALEETLSEIEVLSAQLEEARSQLRDNANDISKMQVVVARPLRSRTAVTLSFMQSQLHDAEDEAGVVNRTLDELEESSRLLMDPQTLCKKHGFN
jgi:chromosome segregation ATPase